MSANASHDMSMSKSTRSLKKQIEDMEWELQDAEDEVEEAERERDRVADKLETLRNKREAGCPRCEVHQNTIEDQNICCPYCGYCDFIADGKGEECPEHSRMAVSA